MESDVLIIGGGVIGLSIARALRRRGFSRITILERGEIGKESSFAAAGMLAPQSETDEIGDFFQFCDESNKLYPQFAKDLFEETGIDIELDQSGTFYLAFAENDVEKIRHRFEFQKSAGLQVEHFTADKIKKIEPYVSTEVREGLYFENDWQVENRKLLSALERFAMLNDIIILENEEVVRLLFENGAISGAETRNRKFSAGKVILSNRRMDIVHQIRRSFASECKANSRANDQFSYCKKAFLESDLQPAWIHRSAENGQNFGGRDDGRYRF